MMASALTGCRILVVDDQEANITLLRQLLGRWGLHGVVATTDPREVLPMCREQEPDLLLLDLNMPGLDGFQVMEQLRPWTAGESPFPILVLTADTGAEKRRRALDSGARDFLSKPFDVEEVRLRVQNLLEIRVQQQALIGHRQTLEQRVEERTGQLEEARRETLERLALAAEFRDDDTQEHAKRIGQAAGLLAEGVGLGAETVSVIRQAAPLHDIGKIAIPDSILLKPGRLTAEEFEAIKAHADIGARLLSGSRSQVLQVAEQIALTHHERWDGQGYPAGLAGHDIPIVGRLVAVADVFDALTHSRPYKQAWALEDAVAEIRGQSGRHFDPAVVAAFEHLDHRSLLRLNGRLLDQSSADPAAALDQPTAASGAMASAA